MFCQCLHQWLTSSSVSIHSSSDHHLSIFLRSKLVCVHYHPQFSIHLVSRSKISDNRELAIFFGIALIPSWSTTFWSFHLFAFFLYLFDLNELISISAYDFLLLFSTTSLLCRRLNFLCFNFAFVVVNTIFSQAKQQHQQ